MAGFQLMRRYLDDDADIDDWMAQRNAEIQLAPDAEAAGREAWSQSTRTGENLAAAQPGDVTAVGVQALGRDDPSARGNASPSNLDDASPLPLATVEPAITAAKLPDADGLTSLPDAFRNASRFATARPGDSISRLLGTSDPAAIGRFLTANGLGARDSTLFAGHSYAIPSGPGDATSDEIAAGQHLLRMDNARVAANEGAAVRSEVGRSAAAPAPTRPAPHPGSGGVVQYGALQAPLPSDQDLAELRRQQAAFSDTTRKIDLQNSWFAAPALAAPLLALGLGAAGEWATGELAPEAEQAVANFVERDPYLRVGDNWATRAGRRAHAALKQRLAEKPGWKYEPRIERPGDPALKPDVGGPQRNPLDPRSRKLMELKPNTPSGRAAAARAVKRYFDATGRIVRPIFYDQRPFI